MSFWVRLQALGLVDAESEPETDLPPLPTRPDHRALLVLAHAGRLKESLSIGLEVTPDECVGAVCQRMGSQAARLKILDVRDKPVFELTVSFEGATERWDTPTVRGLVHNLNDAFHAAPDIRLCAVLGEWQDALHLAFFGKESLRLLFREGWFEPENAETLRRGLEG